MFGCTKQALGIYRIMLGSLLVVELLLRFRFLHPFYSDDGTLPLRLLLPTLDDFYKAVCLHCHYGQLYQQQLLLGIQTLVAILFTLGVKTRIMAVLSWYLYTSLILRNTWLYFILDRYFYYLLFYSMFLPLDEHYTIYDYLNKNDNTKKNRNGNNQNNIVLSPATIALKLLVAWIYLDAGSGKYFDPKQGWTYNASETLPALDTYARHTLIAQYLYTILQPQGLRVLTPIVVYIELFVTPITLFGSYMMNKNIVWFGIGIICSLHIGISMTIRNSVLLSLVACCVWCIYLPIGWDEQSKENENDKTDKNSNSNNTKSTSTSCWKKFSTIVSGILVCTMVIGNIWFETIGSNYCRSGSSNSLQKVWSTILQNRWNVFIGAEE